MECQTNTLDNHYIALLSGQFIFSDHAKFKAVLAAADNPKIHIITIDCSGLEFIDSAGLGMLLLLRDVCAKNKKQLKLRKPQGQVKKVFDISRFEHLFAIEE
jgi:HptB-dependent secretion and biofilm anti anti-sigma factor